MTVKQFKLSKVRLWWGTGCECQTCNSWHVTTCRSWSVRVSSKSFNHSFPAIVWFKTDDSDNIWHHVEANSTLQTSPDSRPWRSPEIHSALLEGPWKFQTSKASAARTLSLAVSMTVAMKPTAMITSVVPHFTAWTWALNLSRLSSLREKPKKPAGFYAGSCNLTVSHLGSSNWIALTSLKIS